MPIKAHSVYDPAIIFPAVGESFKKLNPVTLARNPVMFVTEVGAAISTILLVTVRDSNFGFQFQITLWIWVIVLGANFAEAMAEGRAKAQARALRATQTQTFGRRLKLDGTIERIPPGDRNALRCLVEISDFSRVSFGSLWAPGLEHEPSPEERQLGTQACDPAPKQLLAGATPGRQRFKLR